MRPLKFGPRRSTALESWSMTVTSCPWAHINSLTCEPIRPQPMIITFMVTTSSLEIKTSEHVALYQIGGRKFYASIPKHITREQKEVKRARVTKAGQCDQMQWPAAGHKSAQ